MDARVVMLGDSAWLVEWPAGAVLGTRTPEVHRTMRRLAADPPHGVGTVLAGFDALAVRYDPLAVDGHAVHEWILEILRTPVSGKPTTGTLHKIPVRYDGPDLPTVAKATGLTVEEVVALHSSTDYTVAMVGFAPGFPYLTGLPEALRLPRLSTPRNRVDAGSVAIAGEQAGIYPCPSPGGWRVLGHTDVRLFDPWRDGPPALLAPGDRVRFVRDENPAITRELQEVRPQTLGDIKVVEPGFATTVQDAGRPFYESAGISPGGAMDPVARRVANLLLGNPEETAVLELCMKGPVLRFAKAARVVLVGADASGDLKNAHAIEVDAGALLHIGTLHGSLRAVLAVAGGIATMPVLGSRGTDVRAGFGGIAGRILKTGDLLDIGDATDFPPPEKVDGVALARPTGREVTLRFLAGPQAERFHEKSIRDFESESYEVTTRQDRMGIRLHGPALSIADPRDMRSQPVAIGSIQIPADGRPMVLASERQTHGGYPQIGCVITADLPILARALPGTRVHFRRITLEQAWAALRTSERHFQWLHAAMLCR